MSQELSPPDSFNCLVFIQNLFILLLDNHEEEILSSILIPSYKITQDDKYNKEHAFRIEHPNMKTHYFAADHKNEMDKWIKALSLASECKRDYM